MELGGFFGSLPTSECERRRPPPPPDGDAEINRTHCPSQIACAQKCVRTLLLHSAEKQERSQAFRRNAAVFTGPGVFWNVDAA